MNTTLSHTVGLLLATTLLLGHPAYAQSSDYSTDSEEVDVATIHKGDSDALKHEANVRLQVQHAIYAMMPLNVEVLDVNDQQVSSFTTHDKTIYMHLPEGRYTIKINGIIKKKSIAVEADDQVLKSYAI